jgi:hypothetical protein
MRPLTRNGHARSDLAGWAEHGYCLPFTLLPGPATTPAAAPSTGYRSDSWWGPFGADEDLDPLMRGLDVPRRCGLIADAYDIPLDD